MLNQLCAFVQQEQLITPGDTVVCAVSGGADSMALLFAMYLLKEKLGIQVQAAHFNHNLRGEESQEDEKFVREFCHRYDIALFVGSGKVEPGKKGLEAAARDARYGFLERLPGKIATAHTADDNAETVLMHLVRGTGLKGLGAIAPRRGNVIRPMLTVTRREVLAFLQEYHVSHREDSSNGGDDFLRNRLRHHVMPLLAAENPALAENLSAMALRLRQDEVALQATADEAWPIRVSQLRQQCSAIRSRVLERFLKESGVKEPEARHIAQADALVFSQNPSAFARFPGGVTLRRQYDTLVAGEDRKPLEAVQLSCPGETVLGDYLVVCRPAESIINTADTFTVTCGPVITIRSRQTGDQLRLSGGTRSLKKLFVDRKVPASIRDTIPVLVDEEGVLAVYGIGVHLDRKAQRLPAWQIKIMKNSGETL